MMITLTKMWVSDEKLVVVFQQNGVSNKNHEASNDDLGLSDEMAVGVLNVLQ